MLLTTSLLACLVAVAQPPTPTPQSEPPSRLEAGLARARSGDAEGALRAWIAGVDATTDDLEREVLLQHLARLGRLHPPARAQMVARRDRLESAVRTTPTDVDAIVRLIAFDTALDAGARTADLYEQLLAEQPDADLTTLAWCARPDLWRQRRYAALRTTSPDPAARLAAAAAAYADVRRRMAGRGLFPAREGAVRVMQEALIDFEAMLGTREREPAMHLADALYAFEPTLAMRARLIVHAERAGVSHAVRSLRAQAAPPGDEAAAARLEAALSGARRAVRARGATDVDLPESKDVDERGRGG